MHMSVLHIETRGQLSIIVPTCPANQQQLLKVVFVYVMLRMSAMYLIKTEQMLVLLTLYLQLWMRKQPRRWTGINFMSLYKTPIEPAIPEPVLGYRP